MPTKGYIQTACVLLGQDTVTKLAKQSGVDLDWEWGMEGDKGERWETSCSLQFFQLMQEANSSLPLEMLFNLFLYASL